MDSIKSFSYVSTRADFVRVSHALRSMRRAARFYRETGDKACLSCAVAFRDVLSFYRSPSFSFAAASVVPEAEYSASHFYGAQD